MCKWITSALALSRSTMVTPFPRLFFTGEAKVLYYTAFSARFPFSVDAVDLVWMIEQLGSALRSFFFGACSCHPNPILTGCEKAGRRMIFGGGEGSWMVLGILPKICSEIGFLMCNPILSEFLILRRYLCAGLQLRDTERISHIALLRSVVDI